MPKPLTDAEGDVRELTAEDLASMRPFTEVFPELAATLPKRARGQRGPGKSAAKRQLTLRIDPDVIEAYRSAGAGWQARMNDALRAGLAKG